MNYFFGISSSDIKTNLTIPRFQNSGVTDYKYKLFKAVIIKNSWNFEKIDCEKNENFYFVNAEMADNNNIFFLAETSEVEKIDT